MTVSGQYTLKAYVADSKKEQTKEIPYQIIPTAAAMFALARTTVLKSKSLVEGNQIIMGDDDNAVSDTSFSDPLNV